MVKGITSSGFKFELDEKKLSDWRVIKNLAKLRDLEDSSDENDVALEFISIMANIEELIFEDKGKAFEKHILKTNDGIVAPVVALQELLEILKSNKETKNF